MGLPELFQDKRFSSNQNRVLNRTDLQKALQTAIDKYYVKDLLDDMIALRIPCAEIKNLKQLFKQPEAQKLVRLEKMHDKITKRVTSIAFQISDFK